ncbi:MAG: hypothetical protein ACYDGR_07590 [Candidatus Dormibacteria bacterium]
MAIITDSEAGRRFPADLLRRWFLFGFAAVAGGEVIFALVSGILDHYGSVGDLAGHLPTLIGLGAIITLAQRRALNMAPNWIAAVACGVCTTVAYGAGFVLLGPPMDFLLSIVVTGFATGVSLWLSLRRQVSGAAWCIAAVGVGYTVGAGAGVAAAIMFGDRVDHMFGSGVTGFMGVVGMIGIIAGTIGSLLSAVAMTRILAPSAAAEHSVVSPAS